MKILRTRLCVFVSAALICQTALAEPLWQIAPRSALAPVWQLTEVASVALPSLPAYGTVCSAYDASVCADVGSFYRFRQRYVRRISAVGTFSDRWGVRISITSGAQSPKVSIEPRLVIGLIGSRPLSNGRTISAEVFGSVGGDINHKPCLDNYDREYFCGSLTAWTDFQNKRIALNEYGLKILYRF